MFTFLKKWFSASLCMRVIVVFLYGLVNFTLLLNHTCYSTKEELHSCHLENSSYHFGEESYARTRIEIELNQNSSNSIVLSYRQYCPACLYSLTSKLYKLNSTASMVSVEAVVKIRLIYHLNFTKQFEWLSSAPLRAPPIVMS